MTHTDDRGTVCELYDPRWGFNPDPLVFAYTFTIRPGAAKGWSVHRAHEDRYAFLAGELELVLHDERDDVPTSGLTARLVLSERRRQLLVIPRGVWHAERNMGASDVVEPLDPEGEAHAPLRPELVDQERQPRSLHVLEQERRAAGLDDAVGDLGDLEVGIDLGADADELALALEQGDPLAEVSRLARHGRGSV